MPDREPRDHPACRAASLLLRRLGNDEWDRVLRATAMIGLTGIPVVAFIPEAGPLMGLVIATMWMRGPASVLIPVGLEPVLMLYARIYPPLLVALVATAASAYAEYVSIELFRGVVGLSQMEGIRGSVQGSRAMRWFARAPILAIAFTALSPIPDAVTRTIAAVARYPVRRYVLADTIGRFPKIWIAAALGARLHIPAGLLVGTAIGSGLVAACVLLCRRKAGRREGGRTRKQGIPESTEGHGMPCPSYVDSGIPLLIRKT